MPESKILRKTVDKSTLYKGISIPTKQQSLFFEKLGISLKRGETHQITIQIFNYKYEDAHIINQRFDDNKFKGRNDIVQILYNANSILARTLRIIFSSTTNFIVQSPKSSSDNTKLQIPENCREYIDIYVKDNILIFECFPLFDIDDNRNSNKHYEGILFPRKRDLLTSAFIRNANLIEIAKQKAKGVCQLCGQPAPFIDKQGNPYLEVHHIKWLSQGGTDTLDNVIAICPNCHSKMHILNDLKDVQYLQEKAQVLSKA